MRFTSFALLAFFSLSSFSIARSDLNDADIAFYQALANASLKPHPKSGWEHPAESNPSHQVEPNDGDAVLASFKDDRVVERVRETIYGYPTQPKPTGLASSIVASSTEQQPPATTREGNHISSLKPLFTYFIHHPARALYSYVFPFLFRHLYSLLSFIFHLILSTLSFLLSLLAPFKYLFHVLSYPFQLSTRIFVALTPVWIVILSATVLGAGLGALAGLVTGNHAQRLLKQLSGSSSALNEFGRESPFISRDRKRKFGSGARLEKVVDKGKKKTMDYVSDRGWISKDSKPWYASSEVGSGSGSGSLEKSDANSALDGDDDTDATETLNTKPGLRKATF